MEVWRFLGVDVYDGYTNMAIDEALMRLRAEGVSPNTIRIYRWMPPAVSIGYRQEAREAADVSACRRLGVDIVRRITGGGAVYHDYRWELTYSVVVDEGNPRVPRDLLESYMEICAGLVEGLRRLGLEAELRSSLPLCSVLRPGRYGSLVDVVVGGRKICGSAQARRWGVVLQHGTILVDADFNVMFQVLGVDMSRAEEARSQLTTIRGELGRRVGFAEVAEAIKSGFEDALGVRLRRGWLNSQELKAASKLLREKYRRDEWNLKTPSRR